MSENRSGRIKVSRFILVENWEKVIDAFLGIGFLPVHVEFDPAMDCFTYLGYCRKFDMVEKNTLSPEYRLIVTKETKEDGSETFSFRIEKT